MCLDALESDNFYDVSKSNRKVAERDSKRVLEAYGKALANIHFKLKIDVDIILIGYSRATFKGITYRQYYFDVYEKGTDKFICTHRLRL